MPAPLLLTASLLSLPAAWAQNTDLEYRESNLDQQKERLVVHASIESQWHEYDNLDLRVLDESSDQAILDSDDRNGFAFTGGFFELGYEVDKRTRLVVAASHRGLWGNDQVGNINAFGGWLYFTAMYAEYDLTKGEDAIKARVGRQFYELGGLGGGRDYILADVLDMVEITVPLGDIGHLELMPVGIMGSASAMDNANFVSFLGQSTTETFGFRGDHRTTRYGALLSLDAVEDLNVRLYGFYTDIGALGTGSDISYAGTLGNFVDNDYVVNVGLRGSYDAGVAVPFGSLDYSAGIDRKELVARDVDTNGLAITAGVRLQGLEEGKGPFGRLEFFQAQGPIYDQDGLMSSHGYVGMKAQQVGGTIANRFMGWHPSAYVGMFGITDEPDDVDRISGTRVIHARAGYDIGKVRASAAWWTMQDTGASFVDFDQLDNITPPTGYSREEFAATQRAGLLLGHEANLDLRLALSKSLELNANGALFLPGAYYEIPIQRVAGNQLGWDGSATVWAANVGTEVRF